MVVRVAEPGRPAFQLRMGEEGISAFDPALVEPPLTETEILDAFRIGSVLLIRSPGEIEAVGLVITPVSGADSLPTRLRDAHVEIRPGGGMTRGEFKQALKELE